MMTIGKELDVYSKVVNWAQLDMEVRHILRDAWIKISFEEKKLLGVKGSTCIF